MNDGKDEVVIKIVGKLTMEFPEIDQIRVRNIVEEVLYKYNVSTMETALVKGDIEDKMLLYLACKKLDGLSQRTLDNYKLNLEILSHFINKPIATVDTMDLRMFLAVRCKELKATSTNAQISILKSFFSWLSQEEYIPKNPMGKIRATKVPKRLRHALAEEEVEHLRQACETDRDKALIELLVSSGIRLSEAIQIDVDKINWYEMSLYVIGKGNKERKVYFNTKAKVLLETYIKYRKGLNEALFISERKPYQRIGGRAIERAVNKIAERAKIEKSVFPHLFRHTFATTHINKGLSLTTLQHLMGHETPDTTMIYADLSEETVHHEYKKTS